MKPRTMASRPEINITASSTRSRIVIGIGWSGPLSNPENRESVRHVTVYVMALWCVAQTSSRAPVV
jgi:hypothetical protein